ncbi:MAG: c-type cytochrome [Rhodothermales bacterium]
MKNTTIPAALVGLAISFCCFTTVASAQDKDGKTVFAEQGCDQCHAVSTAGIEAKTKSEQEKGPDLEGIGDRLKAKPMMKYLKKAGDREGKSHTKPFKGSDEELQVLVDWLLEQKAEGDR